MSVAAALSHGKSEEFAPADWNEYGEDPEEHITYLAESITAFINALNENEDGEEDEDDSEDDEE